MALTERKGIWHWRKVVQGHRFAKSTKTGDKKLAEQIAALWEADAIKEVVLKGTKPVLLHSVYEPMAHEYWGKRPMMAKLLEPRTSRDLFPHLQDARIVRVRRALLVVGTEIIAWASKSKGTRYRQTWVSVLPYTRRRVAGPAPRSSDTRLRPRRR